MDHFGIGAAIKSAARFIEQAARGTGRTTSLIESLKDGDRVIFADSHHADFFRRKIRERNSVLKQNLKIECLVVPVNEPHHIFDRGTAEGRTIFDHCWVTAYYDAAIERAANDIDHFQRETSGFGTAHVETAFKALQMRKWGYY